MRNEESRCLEITAMKVSELAQTVHIIWLGLQTPGLDMEYALSCMSLMERELWLQHEKLLQILQESESC